MNYFVGSKICHIFDKMQILTTKCQIPLTIKKTYYECTTDFPVPKLMEK